MFLTAEPTVLDFDVDVSGLGDYIGDALASLGTVWVIPAGLIIAAAVLSFAIRTLKKFR